MNEFHTQRCEGLFFQYHPHVVCKHFTAGNTAIWVIGDIYNEELKNIEKKINELSVWKDEVLNNLVNILNGHFIVICFEKNNKKCRIYNDQMGLQSIYYLFNNGDLYFCDRIRPLIHCNSSYSTSFNWLQSLSYTDYDSLNDKSSLFDNIFLMRPGHFIEVSNKQKLLKEDVYWKITYEKENGIEKKGSEFIEEFKYLLEDSVKIRSNSGSSTNIFLSGGLDSSAVALFASKHTNLKGFSILNPLTYQLSDTQRAAELSEQLSFETFFFLLSFETLKTTPSEWELLLNIAESPVVDLSHLIKLNIYNYSSQNEKFKSNQFLTGFGSDQFTGGITRTTLNKKGLAFDMENHWDTYYEIIKKNHLEFHLNKNFQAVSELYSYINLDYLESKKENRFSNAWHFQMCKQQYLFRKKTIRPEVNIAGYFNQKMLFPYLDYRLMNLIASIPEKYYKELLFDKMILRKIFAGKQNIAGASEPKAAIYIENANNPTFDFYYNLLYQKNDGLAWRAIEELNKLKDVFNTQKLTDEILGLQKKADRSFVKWLMGVVNPILLQASLTNPVYKLKADIAQIQVVSQTELENNTEKIEEILGIRKTEEYDIMKMRVMRNNETMLMKNNENGKYYISKLSEIVFEIDEDNRNVIDFFSNYLDTDLTLGEIIEQNSLDKEIIIMFVKKAIETGILDEYENSKPNNSTHKN